MSRLVGAMELESAQELARTLRLGMLEEAVGIAGLLHDVALVQKDYAVGDGTGKLHLVGNDEHGHALVGKLNNNVEHLVNHLGVKRGGYLVEQHDLRVHHERTNNGDALLLPSRKGRGVRIALLP